MSAGMRDNAYQSARQAARGAVHRTQLPRLVRDAQLGALRTAGRSRGARPDPDRLRLRVLGVSQTYVPETHAGSEITLHAILRELHARGHDTRALALSGRVHEPVVDGIPVFDGTERNAVPNQFAWADVVLATGDARGRALRAGASANRPVAFYVQVGNISRTMLWGAPDLTIFNSHFVERQYPWVTGALVVHPPIEEPDYLTTPGDAITLVNLVEAKGGRLLFELAERMPERQFLGVQGWGPQEIPDHVPPNVTVLPPQRDMRAVYARTRILIMPSAYESYGRVALEAAASGIPTIAHRVGGLREALGDAGIWADRKRTGQWVAAIEALDDPDHYQQAAVAARARFESRDTTRELDALEQALDALVIRGTAIASGARRRRIGALHRRAMATTALDITARTATRRALVLAPHPDDETLGCGATILHKTEAGTEVMVVVASDGERGGLTRGLDGDPGRERRNECLEACRRLGIEERHVRFLGFPDTKLAGHEPELAAAIAEIVTEFRPEEVFVSSGIDQHVDHRSLARAVGSLRDRALVDIELLTYPVWMWNRYAWTAYETSPRRQPLEMVARSLSWTVTTRARRVSTRGLLARKRHALEAHVSQTAALDPEFLAQFLEADELFFPFHDPYRR